MHPRHPVMSGKKFSCRFNRVFLVQVGGQSFSPCEHFVPFAPWVPVEVFQQFVEHGALGSSDCRSQASTSALVCIMCFRLFIVRQIRVFSRPARHPLCRDGSASEISDVIGPPGDFNLALSFPSAKVFLAEAESCLRKVGFIFPILVIGPVEFFEA